MDVVALHGEFDEPIAELRDRLQCEHLRIHFFFEDEHDAQEAAGLRPDPYGGDVRIPQLNVRRQLAKLRCDIDAREIEHDAIRIPQYDQLMLDRSRGFENQSRVFLRRPQSRRSDAADAAPRGGGE